MRTRTPERCSASASVPTAPCALAAAGGAAGGAAGAAGAADGGGGAEGRDAGAARGGAGGTGGGTGGSVRARPLAGASTRGVASPLRPSTGTGAAAAAARWPSAGAAAARPNSCRSRCLRDNGAWSTFCSTAAHVRSCCWRFIDPVAAGIGGARSAARSAPFAGAAARWPFTGAAAARWPLAAAAARSPPLAGGTGGTISRISSCMSRRTAATAEA